MKPSRQPLRFSSASVLLLTLLFGCQTHRQIIDQAHTAYWQNDFQQSSALLDKAISRPKRDRVPLMLDQSMVAFQQGDIEATQLLLRQSKAELVAAPALADLAENSLSMFSDDRHRAYAAEDHEIILHRILQTLCSILTSDGDEVAFSHQLGEQCETLLVHRPDNTRSSETPASDSVTPVALPGVPESDSVKREIAIAPLMRAIVRSNSPLQHDEVVHHLTQAYQWRPESRFLEHELQRAQNDIGIQPGHGAVYLIALVGKGPRKVASTEPVSSQALLIADQILSGLGNYTLPPTIAPIKVARIELSPISFDQLSILVDNQAVGFTENIADLGRLAVERQNELLPEIVARAVVRRIVKKGVVVAAKSKSNAKKNSGNDLTSLVYDAGGVAWEALEQADLRAWALLPGSIQVIRMELPAGNHHLSLAPAMNGQLAGRSFSETIDVRNGQTTVVVGTLSEANATGRIMIPRPQSISFVASE